MIPKNLIVTIPANQYTYHCPLNFSTTIPKELKEWISIDEYTKIINSINVLLQSTIQRSIMTSGGVLCCKTTHVMYFGISDAIRCVNEYLNNNNKYLPEGHSIILVSLEDPPCLKYEIKSFALNKISTTVVKKSGKVVVKHKSTRINAEEELLIEKSRPTSFKGEAILIPAKQEKETKENKNDLDENTPLINTITINEESK